MIALMAPLLCDMSGGNFVISEEELPALPVLLGTDPLVLSGDASFLFPDLQRSFWILGRERRIRRIEPKLLVVFEVRKGFLHHKDAIEEENATPSGGIKERIAMRNDAEYLGTTRRIVFRFVGLVAVQVGSISMAKNTVEPEVSVVVPLLVMFLATPDIPLLHTVRTSVDEAEYGVQFGDFAIGNRLESLEV